MILKLHYHAGADNVITSEDQFPVMLRNPDVIQSDEWWRQYKNNKKKEPNFTGPAKGPKNKRGKKRIATMIGQCLAATYSRKSVT
jgi:hypothetical protein